MRTLKSIRERIEELQAECRRVSGLNTGVIWGGVDTRPLYAEITCLMKEYNSRSSRSVYCRGLLNRRSVCSWLIFKTKKEAS